MTWTKAAIGAAVMLAAACSDDGVTSTGTESASGGSTGAPATTMATTMGATTATGTTMQSDGTAEGTTAPDLDDGTTMPGGDSTALTESTAGSESTAMGSESTAMGSESTAMSSESTAGSESSTSDGSSSSSTGDGGSSSGSESDTGGAPCCDPAKMPICFEGVSCCDDGTWQCNDEMAMPTCEGGLGQECAECSPVGGSCLVQDCCGGLECCSGIPIPPGLAVCYQNVCPISDRNKKEGFAPVDGKAVLETLADIPISTWSYTFESPAVRHIGPMAQDFAAAFGVGASDLSIFTIDADGVALAAIQALHAELTDVKAERDALRDRLDALEARMQALETAR